MSTWIPNESCFIGFSAVQPASPDLVPKLSEVTSALDFTDLFISLTASETGNTVPVPCLGSLFERTIPGTTTAAFTAEIYREKIKEDDVAYAALKKGNTGVFYVSRTQPGKPVALDEIEVWSVAITSATNSPVTSNTPASFSLVCAVPDPPNMEAIVSAT